MRVTLIHNPTAGDEDHSRAWLRSLLAGAGHEVAYRSINEAGWEAALADPADLVVAAGGDGTVCEVFAELVGRGLPATLLPLGSANNIARSLGLAVDDPARLARGWERGARRPFDVGRLRSDLGEAGFFESMGGGIFGDLLLRADAIGADVSGEDKRQHGFELLRGLVEEAPPRRWTLILDGEELTGEFLVVEVMNIGEIGPNLPLARDADPGDGLLDLVLVGPEHRRQLAAVVDTRAAERPAPAPPLPSRRGRRLELGFPPGCCLHLDDELWPGPEGGGAGRRGEATIGDARIEVVVPH